MEVAVKTSIQSLQATQKQWSVHEGQQEQDILRTVIDKPSSHQAVRLPHDEKVCFALSQPRVFILGHIAAVLS